MTFFYFVVIFLTINSGYPPSVDYYRISQPFTDYEFGMEACKRYAERENWTRKADRTVCLSVNQSETQ